MFKIVIFSLLSFAIGFLIARNFYLTSSHLETSLEPLKMTEVVGTNNLNGAPDLLIKAETKREVPDVVSSDREDAQNQRKKSFQDDKGLRLETLLHERFEKGEVQERVNSPGGGKYAKEKLVDGRIVSREYNKDGILIGESGKDDSGEMNKSFFENGQIKGMKFKFTDGTTVSLMNDLSGTVTNRKDELPNGDEIAWEFNDYGEVTRRWLIRKNQKPVLID